MRRTIVVLSLAIAGILSASGCIVATHPAHMHGAVHGGRACPPAHHWNGHDCVHNGNGRGNGNGNGNGNTRDHRR